MKIVHVITTLGVGGAEKHLLMLARGQKRQGHDVQVAYLKGLGELTGEFRSADIPVTYIELASLLRVGGTARKLGMLLEREAPDVVHTHLLKADVVGALAIGKARGASLISSKHNDERALLRWPVSVIHGWLARRVDRTIALSDHVARFTSLHGRVPPEVIRRVYYGIEPGALQPRRPRDWVRRELGLDDEVPVMVCVGRLAPQKDHPTLLRAMRHVPEPAVLLVVGDDPFGDGMDRLVGLAEDLGVAQRVSFLGIRHDVPDLMGASDVFVLASLWEGLGLVFLEAMAVSLPIVATHVSAVPEVVADGRSGWLVPPSDPEALAAALSQALGDPEERRLRGRDGRERLDLQFGLDRMLQETMAVYEEVRGELAEEGSSS